MHRRAIYAAGTAVVVLAGLLAGGPAFAAGFSIFEQGSKAMGMSGAFTAQADDPSAMFHNIGGLGLFTKQEWMAGVTLVRPDSSFQGAAPFPGPGATGNQVDSFASPPPFHVYWIRPVAPNWTFGLAVNTPFGLSTEWDDADNWPGRFLSERAELQSIDVNPALGWRSPSGKLGLGFGVIGRYSKVELENRVATLNPFTLSAAEIAEADLESDFSEGYGWNIGFLHRYNNSFSWGFQYRSKIKVDYTGDGRFTQVFTGNPVFDGIVAGTLPFGQSLPIETSIEFPDSASLGFAFALSPNTVLEADVNWTGWSTFDTVNIVFTENPEFSTERPQLWDDTYHYRLGVGWTAPSGNQWRFGAYFDESPQPDETVSPLLPDADRMGYTVGYGFVGSKLAFDLALLYVDFDSRTTSTNIDNFNGTYETDVLLLGLTIGSAP